MKTVNLRKNKKKKFILITALILTAAIICILILWCGFMRPRNVGTGIDNTDDDIKSDGERRNFLVLGSDRASGLTDVMMLVSLDAGNDRIDILQIPRDTYAEYTESGHRKINGAMKILGGAQPVCDFLSEAFCVEIDGYVHFDLDAFGDVVDAVGGVEVDIPFDMVYNDPYQDLHISLSAGRHTLDGALAEQFVRYRFDYVRGDLGRIDAQKLFMSAFFKKASEDLGAKDLMKLAVSLIGEVDTNIGFSDAISLATAAIEISPENISMLTLAGQDVRSETSGAWFFVISESSAVRALSEHMGALVDVDSFDKNGAFLNEDSARFSAIYKSDIPYKVSMVSDVNKNGIEIEKHS